MNRWVEITFDCLPLRTIGRLDIPLDASPKYRALLERIKSAIAKYGSHNSYYLHNAQCTFHLVNSEKTGAMEFCFEGAVITDDQDRRTKSCDLQVELRRETCDWLIEPVVRWFKETVSIAVAHEFDRYIEAGDLQKTKSRLERIQAASDDASGFLGIDV